jgi:UPF0716 protein FxsA
MLGRLFLLFTLVPLAELWLLVTIGGLIGPWPTIAIVAATGFIGAKLASHEGRRALASYQEAMAKGKLPEEGIVSGLLILAGGVMLITPGVLTDLFGLSMMIPPVRRAMAKLVKKRLQKRIDSGQVQVVSLGAGGLSGPFAPPGGSGFESPGGRGRVVDAEVIDAEIVDDPS